MTVSSIWRRLRTCPSNCFEHTNMLTGIFRAAAQGLTTIRALHVNLCRWDVQMMTSLTRTRCDSSMRPLLLAALWAAQQAALMMQSTARGESEIVHHATKKERRLIYAQASLWSAGWNCTQDDHLTVHIHFVSRKSSDPNCLENLSGPHYHFRAVARGALPNSRYFFVSFIGCGGV